MSSRTQTKGKKLTTFVKNIVKKSGKQSLNDGKNSNGIPLSKSGKIIPIIQTRAMKKKNAQHDNNENHNAVINLPGQRTLIRKQIKKVNKVPTKNKPSCPCPVIQEKEAEYLNNIDTLTSVEIADGNDDQHSDLEMCPDRVELSIQGSDLDDDFLRLLRVKLK